METRKPRRPRRSFTDEFKASATKLVIEGGRTIAEVARDLDLVPSALSAWVEQARADAGKSTRGTLNSDEKAELAMLRKRVRELEIDKAILKKAAAFFAKENG